MVSDLLLGEKGIRLSDPARTWPFLATAGTPGARVLGSQERRVRVYLLLEKPS